jgi:hypothetical protein
MKWAALMLPQEMARTKSHGFLECICVVTEVSLILGQCKYQSRFAHMFHEEMVKRKQKAHSSLTSLILLN